MTTIETATQTGAEEVGWDLTDVYSGPDDPAIAGKSPEEVANGYVALTPLGRLEEPEDVADTVVFLVSDLARYVTGEALNVTGGARMD